MSERLEVIWGTAILDEGFTALPNLVARNWAKVGVKPGEWALITTILTYKHDHRDPYPSQEQLAKDLDCHVNQIKRWTKSLKEKKLIRIGRRRNVSNKQWDNNVYSIKPLLDAIMTLIGQPLLPETEDVEVIWDDENPETQNVSVAPSTQIVCVDPGTQNVSVESEQNVYLDPQQIVYPKRSIKKKSKKNDDDEFKKENEKFSLFQLEVIEEAKERNVPAEDVNEIIHKLGDTQYHLEALDNAFDKVMPKYARGEISSLPDYFVQVLKREQRRITYAMEQQKNEQARPAEEGNGFPFYNWLEE